MIGHDFLGLGSKYWDVEGTLQAFPQGFALGCFDTTFGGVIPHLKKFLDSGKVPAVRIQIWWSDSHKIAPLDVLQKRLPLYEQLAKQYPSIRFYISHSCEYSEPKLAEVKKRVDLVVKLCPSCIPVQTPMNSPVVPGYIVEQHGSKARAKPGQLVSTDGNELQQMDAEAWMSRNAAAEIIFVWGGRYNLREAGPVPPPPQRKATPNGDYVRSLTRIAFPKGVIPTPLFQASPLSKPQLWKTHAEDGPGESDPRANRPCVMLPKKTNAIEIVTFQGELLARFPLYKDTNPHTVERYYSQGQWGFQIAEKAKRASGYEFVWIKQGDQFFGPIHPAFRAGFFPNYK